MRPMVIVCAFAASGLIFAGKNDFKTMLDFKRKEGGS